jgi:hypothetical protein
MSTRLVYPRKYPETKPFLKSPFNLSSAKSQFDFSEENER